LNQSILGRYSRSENDVIVIDVAAEKIEDLYNNFDRNAPYIRKDLGEDLVDYLEEAVSEIGTEEFVIRFHFTSPAGLDVISRVQDSIENYFQYKKAREKRKLSIKIRTSTIYLLTGLVLLTLSIVFNRQTLSTDSVVIHVLAQGLTIAAWISLWEASANLLVHWTPHRRLMAIYERIARAPLTFQ
tara:strand:+ start:855 stop:1409 length:555 start_codon:yes stop_codon:yes gene_type:complete